MATADRGDAGLAKLLGLTLNEYRQLKHSPLTEAKNNNGVTIGYFMHISPENKQELLEKLCITHSNFIVFSVKEVTKLLKKKR